MRLLKFEIHESRVMILWWGWLFTQSFSMAIPIHSPIFQFITMLPAWTSQRGNDGIYLLVDASHFLSKIVCQQVKPWILILDHKNIHKVKARVEYIYNSDTCCHQRSIFGCPVLREQMIANLSSVSNLYPAASESILWWMKCSIYFVAFDKNYNIFKVKDFRGMNSTVVDWLLLRGT